MGICAMYMMRAKREAARIQRDHASDAVGERANVKSRLIIKV